MRSATIHAYIGQRSTTKCTGNMVTGFCLVYSLENNAWFNSKEGYPITSLNTTNPVSLTTLTITALYWSNHFVANTVLI